MNGIVDARWTLSAFAVPMETKSIRCHERRTVARNDDNPGAAQLNRPARTKAADQQRDNIDLNWTQSIWSKYFRVGQKLPRS
jgi:hypothetical protein